MCNVGSVDDRTDEEMGKAPLSSSRFVINKSRYDSIDSYISNGSLTTHHHFGLFFYYVDADALFEPRYNDLPLVYDHDIHKRLIENGTSPIIKPRSISSLTVGMDDMLARHFAHLYIRDPLVIYKEKLDLDDSASSDHFEVGRQQHRCLTAIIACLQNIQSTNWQTMRFKPPPPHSEIGLIALLSFQHKIDGCFRLARRVPTHGGANH